MKTIITVPGIKCDGCVTAIRQNLINIKGIESVNIDKVQKSVEVIHDDSVSLTILKEQLKKIGYPAK